MIRAAFESESGGTMTPAAIATALAGQTVPGTLQVTRLLTADGTAAAPAVSPAASPTAGLHFAGGSPAISVASATRFSFGATNVATGALQMNGYVEFLNQGADPTAPAAGRARFYSIADAAKVEIRARFPSGAAPYTQVVQEP